MQMLASFEDDPEKLEEMYAELMKDPAFAEVRAVRAPAGVDPLLDVFCSVVAL